MNINNLISFILISMQFNILSVFASPSPNESWLSLPASKSYNENTASLDYEVVFDTLTHSSTEGHTYNSFDKSLIWYPFKKNDKLLVKVRGKRFGDSKVNSIKIELLTLHSRRVFKTYNLVLDDHEFEKTNVILAEDVPASSTMRLRITIVNSYTQAVEEFKVKNKLTLYDIAHNEDISSYSIKTYTINRGDGIEDSSGCRIHIKTDSNPTAPYIHGRDDIKILFKAREAGTVIEGAAPTHDLPDTIDLISNSHLDLPLYRAFVTSVVYDFYVCPSWAVDKEYRKYYKLVYESKPSSIDDGEGHEYVMYVKSKTDFLVLIVGGGPTWHRKVRELWLHNERYLFHTWNHDGDYPSSVYPPP